MPLWLVVGMGGFVGAISRFWLSGWVQSGWVTFPLGTLTVNFLGSLILGLIMYLSELRGFFTEEVRVFWTIGVLGSFSTMSTFSYESLRLLEANEKLFFVLNLAGNVILTIFAVFLGKMIVLYLWWE
ncbi:MAG: fluoride efflux transporter CrcB [Nitrospinae bacterium CG11_big_fil_rev_8_21_14_0_20_56_8]|nr:MAG: fluoride efflux transporter CrcB [Nitrospinae bacterium CG11_big_fil_rev_8_21_14_0_20_56_8]